MIGPCFPSGGRIRHVGGKTVGRAGGREALVVELLHGALLGALEQLLVVAELQAVVDGLELAQSFLEVLRAPYSAPPLVRRLGEVARGGGGSLVRHVIRVLVVLDAQGRRRREARRRGRSLEVAGFVEIQQRRLVPLYHVLSDYRLEEDFEERDVRVLNARGPRILGLIGLVD